MNNTVKELVTLFYESINSIPENKKYWLIRTEGGEYFNSFTDFKFIGIGYNEISFSQISEIKKAAINFDDFRNKLKVLALEKFPERVPGFVANQLIRFIYEVKKGDVVLVPSEGSTFVSIGEVTDTNLMNVDDLILSRTMCPYWKRKSVKWFKTIPKKDMDIMLYRALKSHQALTEVTEHATIIERSLKDFYKIDNTTNFIVNVKKESDIPATDLLFFGRDLLILSKDFIEEYKLELDINDVDIKINLNSQGKSQFLTKKNGAVVLIIALMYVGLAGGGLTIDTGSFKLDLSTPGLIQKVIDYQNNYHDREMINNLIKNKESLEIKDNEDLMRALKQFSTNKDLPK